MKKRLTSLLAAVLVVCSLFGATSVSSFAATTGHRDDSSYCTVNISQKLLNKKGRQYAKVKLKTSSYRSCWWNSGAKVRITLRDGSGRYICSWIGKGGDTLKLGDDHSTYRIYIDRYEWSGGVIASGNNWTNLGGSTYWKLSNEKDCTIY